MLKFHNLRLFALLTVVASTASAQQQSYTWPQIRDKFQNANPTLLADALNIQESKADEITANLRPNPQFGFTLDGTQIAPHDGVWKPLAGTYEVPSISQLIERQHKRHLRLESARKNTLITESNHADLKRSLLFNLRSAFINVLQAKAVLQLAKDNLAYWDHILEISRVRYQAGDIAQIDLERLELQRVQYESDVQTAEVNVRTAKIQLLTLLNDRTPIEQFDVAGTYDFKDQLESQDEFRRVALDNRPDLRAAVQSVDKAQTDYKLAVANGSWDPTIAGWYTHNASTNNPFAYDTVGVSVNVPLRIFDRNQGEKLKTRLDISRNEKLRDAAEAQVLSDVDSGYATLNSNLILLRPYKAKYLEMSTHVRDTVLFSYQQGGASLLDLLNAESDYRSVQLNYVNLVGSYLTAAAQLNMAVGQEVIQ